MRPSDGSDEDDLRILQSLLVDDANATLQPEQVLKDSNLQGLKPFFSVLLTRASLLESLQTCHNIVLILNFCKMTTTSFSRGSSMPAVALVAAAVIASSSCCLAFNTPPMNAVRSSGTKLYNDEYSRFYNRGPPGKPAEQQQQTSFEQPSAPNAFGSYLDNLGGSNGAPAEEPEEQVYYEATNSFEPPEATFVEPPQAEPVPEPVVAAAAAVEEPVPNTVAAFSTPPKTFATPPPVSQRAPPLQYDSSPTLSAESPTLSVTLPVALRPPKLGKAKDISYGEASRKFRRTVYTHDDWVNHRSPDRFIKYLAAIPTSGIYKNLAKEVIALTAMTALVMVYNGFITGYQDISGAVHDPIWSSPFLPPLTLPLQPFTLASSSLGLLLGTFFFWSFSVTATISLFFCFCLISVPNSSTLPLSNSSLIFFFGNSRRTHPVFRSNTAYQRWDEARKNWGKNINHTRNLNRMANAYYDRTGISDEQRQADLERVAVCTWAFVRSMKRHLSPEAEDESDFKAELYERLPQSQAAAIIKAAHRPNRALYDLSLAIENLPMHMLRKNEMHTALTIFEDNLGSSERLLTSPVPLIYNRHTARFLTAWLLLMPFALWEPFGGMWNHIGMLPTMALLGILLFGIEELATQMEEPFTILPMQAFCDKIGGWCDEIASWKDGTNGITTNQSYQGRAKMY